MYILTSGLISGNFASFARWWSGRDDVVGARVTRYHMQCYAMRSFACVSYRYVRRFLGSKKVCWQLYLSFTRP